MYYCMESPFLRSQLNDDILTLEVMKSYPSTEEWEASKNMINIWYNYLEDQDLKVGFLFLLQNLIFIRPGFLKDWKNIFDEKREKTKKYIKASAIVIDNYFIRSFINTFFNSFKPERPVKIVKNEEEGIEFIRANS